MLVSRLFPLDAFWTDQQATLFFNVRLPRILLGLMVGCSLAAAGAAFQGTFQNPLVSPDILGASQGAAFGAAIAILLGAAAFGVSASAFAFSIVAVLLVLLVGARAKGNHLMVVVLAGVMVSSLFSAGVSYTKLVADPANGELADITYWLMGSLTGAKTADVQMAAVPMAAGLAVLFALRWRINILTMGDDEAATMGVNARRTRIVVIAAATLVTASSVAVSGMIGWVGARHPSSVPHAGRLRLPQTHACKHAHGRRLPAAGGRHRPPCHHLRDTHRHPHRFRGRAVLPLPHHAKEAAMSIDVERVSFSYGSHVVLRDLTFHIPDNTLVNVLGPNGVGKSTLFRCILCLNGNWTGSIRVKRARPARPFRARPRARDRLHPPVARPPCTTTR